MNLLPRDEKFFELFNQHAKILCRSSELLISGLRAGYAGMCDIQKQMEAHERSADEIIHQIFQRLQSTFITPFDPEDIQNLATGLDNVIDSIEDTAFRVVAYRLDPIPPPALELARMIDDSCQALARALSALEHRRPVWNDCIEVNRLENEADAVERTLIGKLFSSDMEPLLLIKQKEVYELLESTTDFCEDVADVIQNVAVKNS